ncbi:solute carrier family 20 [Basidiobolus meristosporus CBS 931.73]|uniref:Phosphate transporter n=1 Tax=Basidiobolus meristosporus CBS 931.73 TaxID=1314790 RepID=A0A1Y1ZCS4_9FUNG|nr:solute carrier family 20 [Basidiobolus meristosporus CBS 931.73]|eukprot:ORY07615.1 solute carrier family 20 [Basidiobolus meristosporus CBS 931.73]
MEIHDYTWLFVVGMIFSILDAYGIGANDVANSFSTSVASKSLTLAQACCIAIFTEFFGALLLGSGTSETIRGKIIDLENFAGQPELLMLAMVCAVVGSSLWVIFATRNGWPVSTTHAIVGAIIGVGISAFGVDSVDWGYGGVAKIVTSWFVSPVAAGVVASIIYLVTKYMVLEKSNSFERGLRAIPLYFGMTIFICFIYLFYKAPGFKDLTQNSVGLVWGLTSGITVLVMLFCWFFIAPWFRRTIREDEYLRWYHVFVTPFIGPRQTRAERNLELNERNEKVAECDVVEESLPNGPWSKLKNFVLNGVRQDVVTCKGERLQKIHDAADRYDDDTEYMYSFIQVITASMASFAHGSNDVANAVGPLSTIYYVWSTATVDVSGKTPVPLWILAMGGVFIDIGLITYGYNIMRTLGNKITYHSPSRGFSMELGSCLTVLTASQIGLPVSTTHCITGATTAVGLCNGSAKTINWRMIAWCFFSWILTLPCAGLVAGLLFAFAAYAPKLVLTPV